MFKNPIAPRVKEKEKKNPWNFTAPCYDDRNMISAGDNYGKGFNQPVGKEDASMANSPIPMGRVDTPRSDNIKEGKLGMYGQGKDQVY